MERTKVFFRVDGDTQIGLGHLVRCIALANMIKYQFNSVFVCHQIPAQTLEEITENGFTPLQIDQESDFFEYVGNKDIVVLDGYNFNVEYQKKIKAICYKLVSIDDLHDGEFVADLIINHAPGVIPGDYNAKQYTHFALGLDYVLLRPLFLQQAKLDQTIRYLDTIMVCFGGADPKNLTKKVLEIILNVPTFKNVLVVTGAAYLYEDSIKAFTKINSNIAYYQNLSEAGMLKLMLSTDYVIVPASGILFEAMATGCKIISGYYADNQTILYERLKSVGAFIDAGNFTKKNIELAIAESLKPGKSIVKLIDGQSDKNILFSFYDISTSLQRVKHDDCELIFRWANDPIVRSNAFNSNTIKFEEHKVWFEKRLSDQNCYIYILSFQDIAIGQIRFDRDDNITIISYLIDKNYRGLGFGSLIVKKGIEIMRKENNIYLFKALVKPSNDASIKVFLRLGFQQNIEKRQEVGDVLAFSIEL